MRAILINPPSGKYIRDDRCQVPVSGLSSALRMPLDLAYMAAILEDVSFECIIRDYPAEGGNWQSLKQDLANFKPNLLVISVTTPTLSEDLLSCKIAKEINPDIITIAKGAHFIAEDIEVMQEFSSLDIILRRDYEATIKEIGQLRPLEDVLGVTYRKNGKIIRNDDRQFLDNLDSFPLPARHLLNNNLYRRPDTNEPMTSIQTNRGCPANCIFCLVQQTAGKKIVSRLPESIAEEMVLCKEKLGIRNFYFRADTFTWNKNWTIEVCRQILSKNTKLNWVANSRVDTLDEERITWMKKAGCWMIGFGAESGDQDILNKMGKGITLEQIKNSVELCKKHKIKSYLFWVLGMPWDTEESLKATSGFASSLKSDFAEFHIAFPFPGTEFYKIALEKGLFSKDSLGRGDVKRGIARTFYVSRERLQHYQCLATNKYYLNPARIFRLIKGINSPVVFANYLKKGLSVIKK